MGIVKVKIVRLEKDLLQAIKLIDKLLKENKFNISYSLNLDYKSDNYGEFDPQKKNDIFLNPAAFYNTSKEPPHSKYYSNDFSIFAVAIHEFSHLLDEKFEILSRYREEIPERVWINKNSDLDRREELAEVMGLYIVNPYFLKMIDRDTFNFLKSEFRSPTPCTKDNFIRRWNGWPKAIKVLCAETWGIRVQGKNIIFSR